MHDLAVMSWWVKRIYVATVANVVSLLFHRSGRWRKHGSFSRLQSFDAVRIRRFYYFAVLTKWQTP